MDFRPSNSVLSEFKSPAVIFGNAAGDHLLVLPALRALASLFPRRLSLVCMPETRRTFFSDVPLRSVCETPMPSRGLRRRVFNAESVARRIGGCDLLLSLNPWRSGSLDRLVSLLSPAVSIGFSPAFQVHFRCQRTCHAADEAFRVPAYLNPSLRMTDFARPVSFPGQVGPRINEFLKTFAPEKRILAVHNESKPAKMWSPERLSRILIAFLELHPDFAVFVLDFKKPRLNVGHFRDRIIHSRGLPLPYVFGVLQEADIFLGIDSCALHAADLFQVPGVGLFGPTDPRRYGFRFAMHRHIRRKRGMKFISESAVLRALESVLSQSPATIVAASTNPIMP